MNNRNILVAGTGKISVSPDTIIINLTLISEDNDYDKVLLISKQKIKDLNNSLDGIIPIYDIKTTSFTIDTNYQNKLINDNYENIFVGYICRQSLRIEIVLDMNLLNSVIKAIAKSETNPSFNINFTLNDSDFYSNKAIELALNDAKEKAILISNIANVNIKDISKIEYRNTFPIPFSDTLFSPLLADTESNINFIPEDIIIIENVLVTYNIY